MPPPPEVAEGMMTKYVWGSSERISQCAERRAVYFISGKLPQLRGVFTGISSITPTKSIE